MYVNSLPTAKVLKKSKMTFKMFLIQLSKSLFICTSGNRRVYLTLPLITVCFSDLFAINYSSVSMIQVHQQTLQEPQYCSLDHSISMNQLILSEYYTVTLNPTTVRASFFHVIKQTENAKTGTDLPTHSSYERTDCMHGSVALSYRMMFLQCCGSSPPDLYHLCSLPLDTF